MVFWLEGLVNSSGNFNTGYVIDLMGFIRTKMPQHGETAKSYADRILLAIINNRPDNCANTHIVANHYDGLQWYADSYGDIVWLNDVSGCHTRRMASSTAHHLENHMPVEN